MRDLLMLKLAQMLEEESLWGYVVCVLVDKL